MPPSTYRELSEHACSRGLLFLSSPFDEESVELLARLGVPAFKVPSGEVTNHGLLTLLARKQRPLLVSTGIKTTLALVDLDRSRRDSMYFIMIRYCAGLP